jgi:fluoroacetyl-CoA thioesterase
MPGEEERVKPDLQPGASAEQTITTTPEMGIVHLGPDVPSMFSTPAMIQLIEGTCVQLISQYVEPGEQSVGYRVNVRHLAPTLVGKRVTAKVTLREINGRRYVFDVACWNEDGVKIGDGEHERAIIEVGRFAGRS